MHARATLCLYLESLIYDSMLSHIRDQRDVDRIQSRHQEHNPKDCMAAIIQRKYTTDTIQMCYWDQNPKVWIMIPVT